MTGIRLLAPLACGALLAACTCPPEEAPPPDTGSGDRTARVAVAAPLIGVESGWGEAARTTLEQREPEDYPGLHNVYRLSENIISGSEPHDEEAIRRIAGMGVKTILSVDGKAPDHATAAKYGLRYVHVPIHYSGIGEDELVRIAKTFRECEGPFYVHCFHGKHRGPTGAAVGRLLLDGAPRDRALAEMRQWCGTSEKYEGLYQSIATLDMPDDARLHAYEWDFPSAQPLGGFREAMIEVTRPFDNLKPLHENGWQADPEHPDLDASNEATKVAQVLDHAHGLDEVAARPEDFRTWLADAKDQAGTLAEALQRFRDGDAAGEEEATRSYRMLKQTCDACHGSYRNR